MSFFGFQSTEQNLDSGPMFGSKPTKSVPLSFGKQSSEQKLQNQPKFNQEQNIQEQPYFGTEERGRGRGRGRGKSFKTHEQFQHQENPEITPSYSVERGKSTRRGRIKNIPEGGFKEETPFTRGAKTRGKIFQSHTQYERKYQEEEEKPKPKITYQPKSNYYEDSSEQRKPKSITLKKDKIIERGDEKPKVNNKAFHSHMKKVIENTIERPQRKETKKSYKKEESEDSVSSEEDDKTKDPDYKGEISESDEEIDEEDSSYEEDYDDIDQDDEIITSKPNITSKPVKVKKEKIKKKVEIKREDKNFQKPVKIEKDENDFLNDPESEEKRKKRFEKKPEIQKKVVEEEIEKVYHLDNLLIGTCQDMCPISEIKHREETRDLSIFEIVPGTEYKKEGDIPKAKKEWCITKYKRSAAGKDDSKPSEIRPAKVLLKTVDYMMENLIDRNNEFDEIYNFINDRSRQIVKEMEQQMIENETAVEIHEKIIRFYLISYSKLCYLEDTKFVVKENMERLNNSFVELMRLYKTLRKKDIKCPNESEFISYFILTKLDSKYLSTLLRTYLNGDIINSQEIQTTLKIISCFQQKNWKGYTNLFYESEFFTSVLLHMYFPIFRKEYLIMINKILKCYNPKDQKIMEHIKFDEMVHSFAFEDEIELKEFLNYYKIPYDNSGIIFGKIKDIDKGNLRPPKPKRPCLIEKKTTLSNCSMICGENKKKKLSLTIDIKLPQKEDKIEIIKTPLNSIKTPVEVFKPNLVLEQLPKQDQILSPKLKEEFSLFSPKSILRKDKLNEKEENKEIKYEAPSSFIADVNEKKIQEEKITPIQETPNIQLETEIKEIITPSFQEEKKTVEEGFDFNNIEESEDKEEEDDEKHNEQFYKFQIQYWTNQLLKGAEKLKENEIKRQKMLNFQVKDIKFEDFEIDEYRIENKKTLEKEIEKFNHPREELYKPLNLSKMAEKFLLPQLKCDSTWKLVFIQTEPFEFSNWITSKVKTTDSNNLLSQFSVSNLKRKISGCVKRCNELFDLKGVSGIVYILEDFEDTLDYWEIIKQNIHLLLEHLYHEFESPSIPFLVVFNKNHLKTSIVLESMNYIIKELEKKYQKKLISHVGSRCFDMNNSVVLLNKQYEKSIEWMMEKTTKPPLISKFILKDIIQDVYETYFDKLIPKSHKGTYKFQQYPLFNMNDYIILFNSMIKKVIEYLSSQIKNLTKINYPAPELCGQEEIFEFDFNNLECLNNIFNWTKKLSLPLYDNQIQKPDGITLEDSLKDHIEYMIGYIGLLKNYYETKDVDLSFKLKSLASYIGNILKDWYNGNTSLIPFYKVFDSIVNLHIQNVLQEDIILYLSSDSHVEIIMKELPIRLLNVKDFVNLKEEDEEVINIEEELIPYSEEENDNDILKRPLSPDILNKSKRTKYDDQELSYQELSLHQEAFKEIEEEEEEEEEYEEYELKFWDEIKNFYGNTDKLQQKLQIYKDIQLFETNSSILKKENYQEQYNKNLEIFDQLLKEYKGK